LGAKRGITLVRCPESLGKPLVAAAVRGSAGIPDSLGGKPDNTSGRAGVRSQAIRAQLPDHARYDTEPFALPMFALALTESNCIGRVSARALTGCPIGAPYGKTPAVKSPEKAGQFYCIRSGAELSLMCHRGRPGNHRIAYLARAMSRELLSGPASILIERISQR
jgi:hypothetical protein